MIEECMLEIVGKITNREVIAVQQGIRELKRLERIHGRGRWRKLKGTAYVRIEGRVVKAEVHWYECHGIGKKELKIKEVLK